MPGNDPPDVPLMELPDTVPEKLVPPVVIRESVDPLTEPVAKEPLFVVPTGSGHRPLQELTRHDHEPDTEEPDWPRVQLSE